MNISGYCPTLSKDHSINVEYINASTLNGSEYIKGLFTCDVASFSGNCNIVNDCPLYDKAPEKK